MYLTWTVKHSQNNLAFFKHMIKNDKYRAKTAQLVAQKTWIDSSTDASSPRRCFSVGRTRDQIQWHRPFPRGTYCDPFGFAAPYWQDFYECKFPSLHENAPRLSRKGGPLSLMFRKRWRMDLSPMRPLQKVKPQARLKKRLRPFNLLTGYLHLRI